MAMTQHIDSETMRMGQQQQKQPAPSTDEQAHDEERDKDLDKKLDEAIEMTFPASDPISI